MAKQPKPKRVKFSAGMMVGDFRLKRRVRAPRDASPSTKKRWRVECTAPNCGQELTVPEMYMRRPDNPKVNCGCRIETTLRTEYNQEYRIWLMIRERTRNPEHVAHGHYSSNGIDITDEWYNLEDGFEKFFAETGKRPSKAYSMDRIDNRRGYEPGNLRWATSTQQRANQGDAVAGYTEEQIEAAGYTRLAFTQAVARGGDEHMLIKIGRQKLKGKSDG